MSIQTKVRLDKWLWACRFYKTRGLAQEMVSGGKVRYNDERCKPSRSVEAGAHVQVNQAHQKITVIVLRCIEKRVSALEAQTCYTETPESQQCRQELLAEKQFTGSNSHSKPNKKERRQLQQFKSKF